MKLDRLISFFSTNPSAKLLRSPHAAYITHFLYQHFKVAGNLVTPHSILQQQLDFYLDQLHETHPEVLLDRAESYLHSWSTGDGRWLWRFHDAQHAESVYQLSPHTEEVLKFLTAVLDRDLGFVGTESRLTRIIQTLSDIVVRGSSDRSGGCSISIRNGNGLRRRSGPSSLAMLFPHTVRRLSGNGLRT